jgi:mRNA interferase YafQ
MTLKKTATSKRIKLPREVDYAKSFKKDWDRLVKSGRYDMKRLKEVMLLLIANNSLLGPQWRDHQLSGEWVGHRECHIGGDFLLVYMLDVTRKPGMIVFVRAGTHAELFK